MKCLRFLLLLCLLLPVAGRAQERHVLSLPRLGQLSSQRVTQVIQDSEGFLWYATEGGGLCRDDGRQITVFRSDAEHPDLLGSNDVASIAEAAGRYIIIGTFHGAYVLDKHDYSIRRLEDVDDKRVDDVIVGRNGHWWLTANKKIYEYSPDGQLLKTYNGGDKYIFRLHEDRQGRLWGAEWEGGLLRIGNETSTPDSLIRMPWPVDAAPTAFDEDFAVSEGLLIGTLGRGVVKYNPTSGTVERTEPTDSICMSRTSRDLQGRTLVADGFGNCYALTQSSQRPWFQGQALTRFLADSVRASRGLSARPTALAVPAHLSKSEAGGETELWFSTGGDIRRMKHGKEEVMLSDVKDVSAMTFTADGTLWLATIFGTLMKYKDGQLTTDDYALNEFGDGVVALHADSTGQLVIVSDRYVRLYDPVRQTLRQQNIEDEGVYLVELQETQPGKRWSQPAEKVVERMPQWVWAILITLLLLLFALMLYIWHLRRQRGRFLSAMKDLPNDPAPEETEQSSTEEDSSDNNNHSPILAGSAKGEASWLQQAITQVEAHLNDDGYSVEQLANDMCVSRMTFYRKIQSATGQKPTEFMRTIRLRRAAELLREGRMTVSEVSYATGFSSVSYFSRCFRTMFGVPPTLYGNTKAADDK